MPNFSDRLKELRIEQGLTQVELAKRLMMSCGAIGNYESGKRIPHDKDLQNIADYFNVEIDYLLGRSNSRPEFTAEETWIIDCYRNADDHIKNAIKTLLIPYESRGKSLSSAG